MTAAFQQNAFFPLGFQEPISSSDTHDGGHYTERDYKRYRFRLEQLQKTAEKRLEGKFVRQIGKIAYIVEELPVIAPEIKKIVTAPATQIDLSVIQNEIEAAIKYLDAQIEIKLQQRQEQEDEMFFLMSF